MNRRGYGARVAGTTPQLEQLRAQVLAAFSTGKTQAQIAAELKCSQPTVSRILNAAGVVVPRRGWVRRRAGQ
jgi:DNA-binding CsgD family transcriptional regulator